MGKVYARMPLVRVRSIAIDGMCLSDACYSAASLHVCRKNCLSTHLARGKSERSGSEASMRWLHACVQVRHRLPTGVGAPQGCGAEGGCRDGCCSCKGMRVSLMQIGHHAPHACVGQADVHYIYTVAVGKPPPFTMHASPTLFVGGECVCNLCSPLGVYAPAQSICCTSRPRTAAVTCQQS